MSQANTAHHIMVAISRIVRIRYLVCNRSCDASTYKYQIGCHQIWPRHKWMEQWDCLASRNHQLDVLLWCQRRGDPYRRRNAITESSTPTDHVSQDLSPCPSLMPNFVTRPANEAQEYDTSHWSVYSSTTISSLDSCHERHGPSNERRNASRGTIIPSNRINQGDRGTERTLENNSMPSSTVGHLWASCMGLRQRSRYSISGLIYLVSTSAFNSIITSAVTLLNLSYAIPQGIAQCLPKRPLDLGRWGYICNVFAPLWIIVLSVMVCFPPDLPVTLGSMNYSAPVLVALYLIILVFWGLIGDEFKGPDWEILNLKNETPSDASTDIAGPNIDQ